MRTLLYKKYEVTVVSRVVKNGSLMKLVVTATSKLEAEQLALAELKNQQRFYKIVKVREL